MGRAVCAVCAGAACLVNARSFTAGVLVLIKLCPRIRPTYCQIRVLELRLPHPYIRARLGRIQAAVQGFLRKLI